MDVVFKKTCSPFNNYPVVKAPGTFKLIIQQFFGILPAGWDEIVWGSKLIVKKIDQLLGSMGRGEGEKGEGNRIL